MSYPLDRLADEWELRRLAELYAYAADHDDAELFVSLFTDDAYVDSPGHYMTGRDQLYTIPGILKKMYFSTFHAVHNQKVDVSGDTATGTAYCIAAHITKVSEEHYTKFDMGIRYSSNFVRRDGKWLFANRKLNVIWVQTSDVEMMAR